MLYIFLGPNSYEKELAVHKLRKKLETPMESLYAEAELGPWFERLGQSDLFGEEVALLGRDQLDEWSTGQLEHLWLQMDKQQVFMPGGPVVVLLGQKSKLKQIPSMTQLQQDQVVTTVFEKLTEAQLLRWLRGMADSMKLQIPPAVGRSVIERLSGNQFALLNQLRQWQVAGRPEIGMDEVSAVVAIGQAGEIFNFLEAWSNRRLTAAVAEFRQLMGQSSDTSHLLGMLAWQIELLRFSLLAQAADQRAATLIEGTDFNIYSLGRAERVARLWDINELDRAVRLLLEVDARSKSGNDAVAALELWIHESIGVTESSIPKA